MSEDNPIPSPLSSDPMTAILLAVTRMEGQLSAALDVQRQHGLDIRTLNSTVADHSIKLNTLETHALSDQRHEDVGITKRALLWTAFGACFVALSAIIALVATWH